MRFSDFLLVSDPGDLDFIVGYTEEQNIRISVTDFFAGFITGSGTPGYVPVFTSVNGIGDSSIYQDGSNIVIGGEDSLDYTLAVSGSFYVSNGAVIDTTVSGDDGLRVIAEEGDIFIVPNDLGQSISSLRRIIHPPALITTESATLGQVNTAVSDLEGDIEILLDLKVDKSSVGEPNGVASLDATGKIPLSEIPDSIIGQVEYMGTWNAFTNTPTLNPLVPEQKGHYYVVSAAGVFGGVDYAVGDWIISNGVEWQKVDNTDAVTSVFGRIGAILPLEADYQSFYPRLSQAYDNPTWINSLAFTKITDVPPFLLENQTITLSGDVTGSGKTSISSTISNNAVSNEKLRDSVGTSVIGRADNSTGDPADIQASTDGHVLLRSAGNLLFGLISSDSISSIDWSKITGTPTTLGGYGITDAYTKTESDNKFVPYTGANANVNLGLNSITANSFIKVGGTSAQFLKADGSVDLNHYVPTTRSVNAGTGLTGGGNLSSDVTIAFDTGWGDNRYAYRTREIIAGLGLLGGGDLSANRTLSFDTVWGDARYLAPLAGYVPYTGATTNVNLGEYGLRAGYLQLDTTPTNTPTAQGTIFWDEDDNTIGAVLNGYIMKIGEDLFYPVKNQTGSTIAKGTAVRFAGTVGSSGRLLIVPFIADGSVPSTLFMGVTAETILDGEDGKVLWFGRIRGINTNGFNEGDILYASTTVPGGFQTTVPVAPNNIIQVAAVITKSINQGTLFIRPTLGSNINKDEGVKITSPSIGQLLQLQSGNIWENKSLGQVIGGLSTEFLKGDGSLDSTSYVPFSRQITINGVTYDLSLDRSYSVGTVTSVGLSVPTGFAVSNTPITSNGDIILSFDSGYSLPTNAKQLEWDTAYANRIASLTTNGTSGAATFISNVLNIPQYQAQGNYITDLTGEVTANGPGSVAATISNAAVINKVLTGLSVTGSSVLATDTILEAFGKLQGQVNGLVGGLQYQGTWDASTNTPTITSGVGTEGYFYIVSVAGNTVIDGMSGWQVGDWIVYHSPSWQKVDNTESVTSVNGQVGAVNLSTTEIPEGSNLYYTDARSRQSISLTVVGSSGAATYNNGTGVFNIPQYTLGGLGGVPTSRQLTINGVTYDLSSDRSWIVGDVRTDSSYANPSWITSLAWSKITGTPTTLAGYGITDAYTQAQVNSLLSGYVTLATDQTITGLKTIVRSGDVLNFKIGTDTLYGLKVAYNQNELVPSGEATWSFVNTFNRNGVGYDTTPISFFRGMLITGERLPSVSINDNLLDYYANNPSGRYPIYAYNTGVQQFSTGIIVGKTTGVVYALTGAVTDLPSGVVANFNGRVIGQSATNSNEFVTLSQLGSYVPTSRTLTINGVTFDLSANRSWTITSGVSSVTASSPLFSSGGATPNITIQQATATQDGFLSSSDWSSFSNKVGITGGGGSTNTIPKFTSATTIGNSLLTDNGSTLSYVNDVQFQNGKWYTVNNTSGNSTNMYIRPDGNNSYVWRHIYGGSGTGHGTGVGGYGIYYDTLAGDYSAIFSASGFVTFPYSARSPIFYDSNNTGYYVDPASTSNLNGLTVGGSSAVTNNGGTWGINITGNATYSLNATRLYASDAPYTYGGSSPYYMAMTYDGTRWLLQVTPGTPSAVRVSYADSSGSAGSASSVPWSGVTSKPSYLMYYQGFTLDANTMDTNATGFTYGVNAPFVGPIARFSANFGYDMWINSPYSGGGTGFAFRTVNGDTGTINPWRYPAVYNVNANGGGDLYATAYYDQNNTAYYADLNSTGTSINIAGSLNAATFNKPAILVNSSGTSSAGAALGMQQVTAEGWTGIFVDFEPNTGWGLYHDNPNNFFLFTSEVTTGAIGGGFTVPSRSSGNRTAYTKFLVDQTTGDVTVGRISTAQQDMRTPIFYDSNDTGFYLDPNSYSRLSRVGVGGGANDVSGININGDGAITGSNFLYFGHTNGSLGSWQTRTFASGGRQIFNTNGFEINRDGYGGGWSMSINSTGSTNFSSPSDLPINITGGNHKYLTINPGNGWEAMVRYIGGSGSSWYVGKRTSSGINSTADFHFYSEAVNADVFGITTGGIAVASGDFRAPIFYDSNNTGYYVDPASTSVLNGLTIGGRTALNTAYYLYHSNRDFASGTLVQTNIDYSVTNGDPFILEITGNSYGALIPFDIQVQGYIYANTIINSAGISNGTNISGLRAINFNGNLCFWWPRQSYWQGFNVKVYSAYATYPENRVTSITDSGQPTTSKQYDFAIYQSFHTGNISLFSSYDITFNRAYSNTDMRAPIFYDSNDTAFYLDPNSSSRVSQLDATVWLRAVNGSVIGTGAGGSITMTAASGSFGGYLRTSGHMVLDQANAGYNVYVLDGNSVGVVKNAGSQSWSAFSDITLKTVHSVMDNNLSKLESISPIYYSFNNFADDKNRIGLIAQEVQEHFPELVEVEPRTQKLVLDYTGLIPVLLGAIKELKKEIDILKTN
jgi:hypothetical protein